MSIELQEIDCNCNDCKCLERSISNRQKHVDFHFEQQKRHFNTKRIKLIQSGELRLKKGEKKSKTNTKRSKKNDICI